MNDDNGTRKYSKVMHTRITPSEQTCYQEVAAIAGTNVAHWVRQTLNAEVLRCRRRQQRSVKNVDCREVAA